MADAIGLMAGALTTVAFVPQVLKTWRSRSAGDLSLSMLLIFNAGVALWVIYGLAMRATPIVVGQNLVDVAGRVDERFGTPNHEPAIARERIVRIENIHGLPFYG